MTSSSFKSYANFAFLRLRFDHITSNTVESLNGVWNTLHYLPQLRMLVTICLVVTEAFCERRDHL
jgi:hypothetical protein